VFRNEVATLQQLLIACKQEANLWKQILPNKSHEKCCSFSNPQCKIIVLVLVLKSTFASFAWTYQHDLSAIVQCFSLTTNQRTMFFSINISSSEHSVFFSDTTLFIQLGRLYMLQTPSGGFKIQTCRPNSAWIELRVII
jgi:hypothetical protein